MTNGAWVWASCVAGAMLAVASPSAAQGGTPTPTAPERADRRSGVYTERITDTASTDVSSFAMELVSRGDTLLVVSRATSTIGRDGHRVNIADTSRVVFVRDSVIVLKGPRRFVVPQRDVALWHELRSTAQRSDSLESSHPERR